MNSIIRLLFIIISIGSSIALFAHDFEVNGIFYCINGNNVSVTFQGEYYEESEYSGSVIIPETVTYNGNEYSVTSIGSYAFRECTGLTHVQMPCSITSIETAAFDGCSALESIDIPNSVISINVSAFRDCSKLKTITIPSSVISLGNHVFSGCCGLEYIIVDVNNPIYDSRENSNAIIETSSSTVIVGCKNTLIPNSVKSIGNGAFYNCKGLITITIPNSVTVIEDDAFSGCNELASICIPESVTSIGSRAFEGCDKLLSILIPNSITNISNCIFASSGLISVTIPNSVTTIGGDAFSYCDGLTSVIIPSSITCISNRAFYHCDFLQDVYCYIPDPSQIDIGMSVFLTNDSWRYSTRTLHVPIGSINLYKNFDWRSYFGSIIEMEQNPSTNLRGDVNGDGNVNISDVTSLIDYLLGGIW